MSEMGCSKILIVEDEPVIALDIEQRLNCLGYEVAAIADSAEAALQAALHTAPDLVLMDIQLSGELNGIALSNQLQQQHNLPIIFLTAHTDSATVAQAKAVCPFGYITKPFKTTDLSIAIEIAFSRYEAERSMQRALEQQAELSRIKSEFMAVISHEFRNPLGTLLITLGLLQHWSERIAPEKRKGYLEQAIAAVDQMESLLEEFRVMSEAENGKLCCRPTPLDLYDFCTALIEELRLVHGTDPAIQLIFENRQAFPHVSCDLDPKLLRHILINLLTNAIKYSPLTGIIHFQVCCDPETIAFRVQDQGIGIPQADQAALFDPFYRATNVGTIPGSGLGLAIVNHCVIAHGGRVTVQSEVGAGATFTVTLPCVFSEG
jgi:signal transduction histidine kinase